MDGHHDDEFDLAAGEEHDVLHDLGAVPGGTLPEPLPFDDRIEATRVEHERWVGQCVEDLPHADLVRRSLLTLRLMTHAETGGIVAAPTTTLPEDFGGERNWDYRYCWLRDAALTLESLLAAGYTDEAPTGATGCCAPWRATRQDLQIMYTVDGGRRLPERRADPPRRATRPRVRSGSATARWTSAQTDVLGEVMIALEDARAGPRRDGPELGPATRAWWTSWPRTGTSPTTASGRSAVTCGTSPTRG